MVESDVVVYDGSLENNVLTGKWNTNKNCIQCLNLRREVGRLHQELSSVNEIIKLLKKDMDLIQRYAKISTTRDHTNADWYNLNRNIRSNEWQIVEGNKKWKNNTRNDTGKSQQMTIIVNQFAVLSRITSGCDRQKQLEGIKKKQIARNKKELGKNKIILMGDSHIKGYASELLNRLDRKYEVMPGARIQNIVQLCEQEVNSLTRDDMVILRGGLNDVAKNETMNGFRHLRKFINRKKNTNFILITVPHRYDLMDF
jgi:adenosyl cobinamide kinase/adenosyl cobinamide phosphate guanylyltransferase